MNFRIVNKTVSGVISFPSDHKGFQRVYHFSGITSQEELECIHRALENFHGVDLGLTMDMQETKTLKEIF